MVLLVAVPSMHHFMPPYPAPPPSLPPLSGGCSVAYQQGQGFDPSARGSARAALHWASCAAAQGHARAQLLLGAACDRGVPGVARPDWPRAAGWFLAAAEQVGPPPHWLGEGNQLGFFKGLLF